MADAGTINVHLTGDMAGLENTLTRAEQRLSQAGQRMQDIGGRLSVGLSAPILGIGGALLAASMQFEDAFAGVRKTVSEDTTPAQLARLSEGFTKLSEEIPVSAAKLAGIGEAAAQLGVETPNILGFTRVIAAMGVATNLTTDQAAESMAQFANITGMAQSDFQRLGSAIVATGAAGASSESAIMSMAMRVAGAGATIGMTEAQIVGVSAALSDLGIEAEMGGTAISKVMLSLYSATKTGGAGLANVAQVARMSSGEFKRAFEEDAGEAVVTFVEGLQGLKQGGENMVMVLDALGFKEERVRNTLLRLANSQKGLRGQVDRSTEAWAENKALTEEAAIFYGTTSKQLQLAANRVVNLARAAGDQLKPAFVAAVEAGKPLLGVLDGMVKGFAGLPKWARTAIIGFFAFAAVLGPVVFAVGTVLTTLGAFTSIAGGVLGMLLRLPRAFAALRTAASLGSLVFSVRSLADAKTLLVWSLGRFTGVAALAAGAMVRLRAVFTALTLVRSIRSTADAAMVLRWTLAAFPTLNALVIASFVRLRGVMAGVALVGSIRSMADATTLLRFALMGLARFVTPGGLLITGVALLGVMFARSALKARQAARETAQAVAQMRDAVARMSTSEVEARTGVMRGRLQATEARLRQLQAEERAAAAARGAERLRVGRGAPGPTQADQDRTGEIARLEAQRNAQYGQFAVLKTELVERAQEAARTKAEVAQMLAEVRADTTKFVPEEEGDSWSTAWNRRLSLLDLAVQREEKTLGDRLLLITAEQRAHQRGTDSWITLEEARLDTLDQIRQKEDDLYQRRQAMQDLGDDGSAAAARTRLALVDAEIARERQRMGLRAGEAATASQATDQYVALMQERQAAVDRVRGAEQAWADFRIRTGELTLRQRLAQIDAEMKALVEANRASGRETLALEEDRFEVLRAITTARIEEARRLAESNIEGARAMLAALMAEMSGLAPGFAALHTEINGANAELTKDKRQGRERRDTSIGRQFLEDFQGIPQQLGGMLVSAFGPAAVLMPIINAVLEELAPVVEALLLPLIMVARVFGQALIPVLRALWPVFKGLAIGASFVAQVMFTVSGSIQKAVGWLVRGLGKLIDKIPGLGDFGLIKAGQALVDMGDASLQSAKEMGKVREEIRGMSFEDAMKEVGDSAKKAGQELRNVPTGFKRALEVFRAANAAPAPGRALSSPLSSAASAAAPGGEATTTRNDNRVTIQEVHIHAGDEATGRRLMDQLRAEATQEMLLYGNSSPNPLLRTTP